MDLSLLALLIVVALGAHALGARGCAAGIVGIVLLGSGGTAILAWGAGEAQPHLGAMAAAGMATLIVGVLVYRWIHNALVEADFRRDVEGARKKADGRRV